MDENKKRENEQEQPQSKVVKVASVKPKQPDDTNIFSSVYKQQKNENAEKALKKENEEIKPTETDNIQTVVSAAEPNDDNSDKFKILFIFLIIITVVMFAASILYLFLGKKNAAPVTPEKPQQSNTVSASLTSPFKYQQTYDTKFPDGIQEKYKALYAQNSDFVGWLTVPGTCIDFPVYKQNNNDYYLKHDNYGEYTKYGVPFMDMYDDVKNLSRNTTIYGHNFDNKLIFDEIHNYRNLEFYKENPVIEFNTIYKDYKWKVIAAFHTNGESAGDNNYLFYYVAADMGNNSFMKFHDELLQRSYIHTGVDVQPTDKILTLSTCTYFFDTNGAVRNARFALIARLVRDGESEEVDTSLASENKDVRYPQLYYTAYGGTNPYKNASKWVPEAD